MFLAEAILDIVFRVQDCSVCPGSAFTSIGAAFATQGYWLQADVLHMLNFTSFKDLVILFYVLAAIGGIISMGLGMPPKLYLWFFIGPGIFHWLIATPANVNGVQWLVANRPQAQTEVWKLAEAGLRNTRIFAERNYRLDPLPPRANELPYFVEPSGGPFGDGTVQVANAFVWFDETVSSVIQWMVSWFGAYSQLPSPDGDGNLNTYASSDGPWHLLSNLKWGMLEDITAAKLHNGDLRDLFVTFLGSECGDKLKLAINNANFVAASNSKGGSLPDHVITNVEEFHRLLASQEIPTPKAVQNLFTENKLGNSNAYMPGSFRGAVNIFSHDLLKYFGMNDSVSCSRLLYIIVNGFRWEAGHIYAQFLGAAPRYLNGSGIPEDMTPEMILQTLYYGWDIKRYSDGIRSQLTAQEIEQFTINLIIIHLFRNEMIAAPRIQHVRTSATIESQNYADIALRTTGSKAKYGELYEWARMVPYMQGVLLYYLALAYPFACMMMVVPGWHKMLFTWMSFWAWAKLWDLGFAVVMMAERSIWAMLGNSADAARVFGRVVNMDRYGGVLVKCVGSSGGASMSRPLPCRMVSSQGANLSFVPDVKVGETLNGLTTGALPIGDSSITPTWRSIIEIFDQAITIGSSIDLDRSNAYYIYIMAGLYFAVPMVTGQLVLGSKAGMAGFVKDIIGGAASEAGRAAASGFTANQTALAQANSASLGQAAAAKSYRASGLAKQAMDLGNMQLAEGLAASSRGQEKQGLSAISEQLGRAQGTTGSNLSTGNQMAKMIVGQTGSALAAFSGAKAADGYLKDLAGISNGELVQVNGGVAPPNAGNRGNPAGSAGTNGGRGAPAGGTRLSAPGGTGLASGATGVSPLGGASGRTGVPDPRAMVGWMNRGVKAGYSFISPAVAAAVDMAGAIGNNELTQRFNGARAGLEAAGSQAGLESFRHGQYGQALQTHGGRIGALAQFDAQTGAWEAKRDFANQASGALAAMGVQPGTLSPGPKPEDMTGMAMSGMLGAPTRDSGYYAAPGGAFFKAVNSDFDQLQTRFGYGSTLGAYTNNVQGWQPIVASSFSLMGDTVRQFETANKNAGHLFGGFTHQYGSNIGNFSSSPVSPSATSSWGTERASGFVQGGAGPGGTYNPTPINKPGT